MKIRETKEILLSDLVIGKGQVRIREVGKEIDELATSIKKIGLLEPIVVSPAEEEGKYEILTGQRRYLAHIELGEKSILASVLNEPVDEITAKVISITENLVRTNPNPKDYIDACTTLYRKYGSIKAVAEETGLPYHKVQLYVKFDRLKKELRKLVEDGEVDLKVALRAQDAASTSGVYSAADAVKFAKEMSNMSGAQQTNLIKKREEDPDVTADDIIEAAKTGQKITQLTVTITSSAQKSLKNYAKDESTSMDDAAATLINDGLSSRGYSTEV